MPRNVRGYLGRGRGSTSKLDEETYELASAMAAATRRGRSSHEAVLRIFTVNPLYADLYEPALKVPEKAIRSSLKWFVEHGDQTLDRRVERALNRVNSSTDEAADIIYRIATKHFRGAGLHPEPTADLRPRIWGTPDENSVQNLALFTIGKFLGTEEIGPQKLAEILLDRPPSGLTKEEIEATKVRMEEILTTHRSAGSLAPELSIEETIRQLEGTSIGRIRKTRNRIAVIAEMGNMYLHLAGSEMFEDIAPRILDATTASFDNSFLFHSIVPIAETLQTRAWHRMSAVLITILASKDARDYQESLDQLFAAMAPELLRSRDEIDDEIP